MAAVALRTATSASRRAETMASRGSRFLARTGTRQTPPQSATEAGWRSAPAQSRSISVRSIARTSGTSLTRTPLQPEHNFTLIASAPRSPTSTRPISSFSHIRHRYPWPSIPSRSTTLLHRHLTTSPPALSSPPPPPPKPPTTILAQPLQTLQQLTPHENIYTIPNLLTFTRLLSAPLLGYLILTPSIPHTYALFLFIYASITDLLDGYLARRLQQFTVVGSVIDPMADKLLMTICTFTLAYTSILPLYCAAIIIGRDIALAISAIWWRWISLPPPKTMTRYWDFSLPSAEVHPTEISKINTLLQLLLIGNAMVLPVVPGWLVEVGNLWGVFEGWCGLVAATTVWSGLSYVGNKEAVRIVSQEQIQEVLDGREEKEVKEGGEKSRN